MSSALSIVLLTAGAGACIPAGGLIASFERIRPQWLEQELRHFIIAVGGGVLLGAVALVLIPEGVHHIGAPFPALVTFVAGGLCFFGIEWAMGTKRRQTPQLMGLLLDYVPEAIALGGLAAVGSNATLLLAILIGLQNLPEGFNTYRELIPLEQYNRAKTLGLMTLLVALGPIAGLFGFYLLSEQTVLLGGIMLFAAGGILYLIFQDIAPQSVLKRHWAPPLGAVIGFSITLLGQLLLESHQPGSIY